MNRKRAHPHDNKIGLPFGDALDRLLKAKLPKKKAAKKKPCNKPKDSTG